MGTPMLTVSGVTPVTPAPRPAPAVPLSVSVILPVMNETWSLETTVTTLIEDNRADLEEILIVTSPRTRAESKRCIQQLQSRYPALIRTHQQTLPYLGGALREALSLARGRTTLLMASDLETDPGLVPTMIDEMRRGDYDIIVASRWLGRHGFHGYSKVKYGCNFMFQRLFACLYRVRLTDLTYGFRLYRTDILQRIRWEELSHAFLFEALVKPLRLGSRVREVAAVWQPRREGQSHNMLSAYAAYFRIGTRVLARRPQECLNDSAYGLIPGGGAE